MDETKTEIQETKQSIAKVEAQLDKIPFDTKDEYLREKERQLREEKKQLPEKERQLNDQKLILLQQTSQPVAYKKRKLSDLDDAPIDFQRFWDLLKNTSISQSEFNDIETDEIVQYNLLDFSMPVPLLKDSSVTNKIFIRRSYEDLWNLASTNRRFLLTGNPGVGKSIFLIYILFKIRQSYPENTSVVLRRQKDEGRVYVFTQDGVKVTDRFGEVDDLLSISSNWYLVDTIDPGPVDAKTIVVSSPQRKHYKEFKKFDGTRHYHMPIWSLLELNCAIEGMGTSLDLGELLKRFELVGGIPRKIFSHDYSTLVDDINFALQNSDLPVLLKSIGEFNSNNDTSHNLIHVCVVTDGSRPYLQKSISFASPTICRKVLEKLENDNHWDIVHFLKNCSDENADTAASMFGQIFEVYAHRILIKGGSFRIRDLSLDQESILNIAPLSDEIIFTELNKCRDPNYYYKPKSKSFAVVDSFVLPIGFFQMTVSKTHPIKMNQLSKLIEQLPSIPKKIYFVVPKGIIFDQFQLQDFHTIGDKKATNINTKLQNLQQYSLFVSFN